MNFIFRHSKILLFILFFSIGFSFPSCYNDCDCSDTAAYFDINGLRINHSIGDNFGYYSSIENEITSFERYKGLQLEYLVSYYGFAPKKCTSFSLMNSALACECALPGYNGSPTEWIESIEITTLFDFDDDHLAGSSINDLFNIDQYDAAMSLLDFLAGPPELIKMKDLNLKLNSPPVLDEKFQVNVKFKLSSEEVFEQNGIVISFTE